VTLLDWFGPIIHILLFCSVLERSFAARGKAGSARPGLRLTNPGVCP